MTTDDVSASGSQDEGFRPEVIVRLQPNSCSNGSSNAPVEERKPAAATRAPNTANATHHARWTPR